ncbi:putative beta-galactosidase-like [Cocos nucifera]|nr:putative beta-galactosidase-like [Cocos nucifera]
MECSKRSSLLALVLVSLCCLASSTDISHDGRALKINGERRIIISGAIHYPRSTPEMWPDLLRKAKEGGLDTIETYIFWNGHEPRRREYYFEGNYDVIRFFKEIQNAGLYAILRIGPYVCAEWDYGSTLAMVTIAIILHPIIQTVQNSGQKIGLAGNLKQPKWGHLKELHAALKSMEKSLTYGEVNNTDFGNGVAATKFSYNATVSGCFLSNANQSSDATLEYQGTKYFLPAWSVSILPDCKQEVYNTAKVTTQTSIMVKKPNKANDEASDLKWSWRPETLGSSVRGLGGNFTENKLLEQIITAVDESDYLWYMTSVDISHKQQMTLRVNTTGHVLHAFVNGQLVGSQYGPNGNWVFVFERTAKFKAGKNHISLLSVTVGLKNYGARYELEPAGIVSGPVQLIGGNITIDLSTNAWSYKIGLDGEKTKVYLDNPDRKWYSGIIPTQRPFTWYKVLMLYCDAT